jgi:peptidylprolyl isomerase
MKSIRIITALVLSLLLAIAFVGCTNNNGASTQVAATVNGVEILESDVTTRIETFRIDQSTGEPMDDVAWAQMLKSANYTPETLREFVIRNQFAIFALILQKASDAGITPDAAQVDQGLADTRASVESSGATWESYLQSMGYSSEAAYHLELEARNVAPAFVDSQVKDTAPTQAAIEDYVSKNAFPYVGKRVSLIYLPFDTPADPAGEGEEGESLDPANEGEGVTGEETPANPETSKDAVRSKAEEALTKLRAGGDFAEIAKEYSQAANVESDGGDLGWGSEISVPEDVRAILGTLPVNEVSDVIETNLGSAEAPQYAFMIVKWTDEFVVPEDPENPDGQTDEQSEGESDGQSDNQTDGQTIAYSSVPADLASTLSESFIAQEKVAAQQRYFDELVNSDEIVINPMPAGLSYAVDMSLADEEEPEQPEQETPAANADNLGITDTVEGTGPEAKTGDELLVHYTGYLDDGTIFDSSVERGTPYPVTLGQGQVIQGWDLGLVGMKVGGKRQLVIPPELAYGATGQGSIPPNATLTFDVELLSVNGDDTGSTAESESSPDEN